MQSLLLESIQVCSLDIQQRIRNIDERLKKKQPGFRSVPAILINSDLIVVEESNRQATNLIESSPWREQVLQSSKLEQELDGILLQTVSRSTRLRTDLRNMAGRLGCQDKSDAVGNYVARFKYPAANAQSIENPDVKLYLTERRGKHSRAMTDKLPFESEKRNRSTDKRKQYLLPPTSDWDFKSENSASKGDEETVKPAANDTDIEIDDFMNVFNKTELTGIEYPKEMQSDQTINSYSILQNLEPKELKIASVSEYMQEYLTRIREQQLQKPNPLILKYLNKMQKRITEVSNPLKETSIKVRSSSKIDKDLETNLQLQYSMRDKLLKRIFELRDPHRYK